MKKQGILTPITAGKWTYSRRDSQWFFPAYAERMAGGRFKEEHVGRLPFSYFFPERLPNPRLSAGQARNAACRISFTKQ